MPLFQSSKMMQRVISYSLTLLIVALSGCGSLSEKGLPIGSVRHVDVQSVIPNEYTADRYLLVRELNTGAMPVFFYQDHEGYTHFSTGGRDVIINRTVMDKYKAMGAVPLAMSYGYDGRYLYFSQPVKWTEKKLILIKLRPDGEVLDTKELSTLGQVMSPASFAFDADGKSLMCWIDETAPRIKVVYTTMSPDGHVEPEKTIADNADSFSLCRSVQTPKGLALVYLKLSGSENKNSEVRVRWVADGNDEVIYSQGKFSGFEMAKNGEDFLIVPTKAGDNTQAILFNSTFQQKRSYTVAHPTELGAAMGVTDALAMTPSGPVLIGGGYTPKGVSADGVPLPVKPALYVSSGGKNFEPIVGILPHMFSSEKPAVAATAKGAVIAYSDRRFATTTPMLSVVEGDGIRTRDVNLEGPNVITGQVSLVVLDRDTVRAFYPLRTADKDGTWTYRTQDLNISRLESKYDLPPTPQRQERLLDRARKYAECRLKNDYQCIYDMLDPAYRSMVTKEEHEARLKSLGATLQSYTVESCTVLKDSVLGNCKGEIAAELPKELMGKAIPESQRKVAQQIGRELWVYSRGEWYYAVELPAIGYLMPW